ncbi:hypothetical protein RGF97_10825 [Streptomyces roseicoloratus]|uniref:Transposase IS204/IS1001/IS1096/IS1165 DDE domain-containing protein n=1 Tax=Streptomyces roseicoloratus TaxID=2508722 RepID=A0ABY9RSU1_9ACTN|nr:hypothetical protein [Streptomyces roseicoloratus]WMX45246.1 hypothetical protein RGF97_10825 [Streptomyces roseicoloratus]
MRRLYCENPSCPKVTFAEQVPGLTMRYQRRTPLLQGLVEAVGVVLACRGGARMLRILNITLSRCTVLSQLMRMPLPPLVTPRVLGVDDFALYGDTYSTLLVDATTRLPLTLWQGRDAEQLSQWLREHPGVEVACRDGSLTYQQGITTGAPMPYRSVTAFTSGRASPAASRTSPPPTAAACRQRCPRPETTEAPDGRPRRRPTPPPPRRPDRPPSPPIRRLTDHPPELGTYGLVVTTASSPRRGCQPWMSESAA